MEIGATKAVQERLKSIKAEAATDISPVFCWDTHLVKAKGRNVLLIVNASNRYTIAMTDIEPRNWSYYTLYIGQVIRGIVQDISRSVMKCLTGFMRKECERRSSSEIGKVDRVNNLGATEWTVAPEFF